MEHGVSLPVTTTAGTTWTHRPSEPNPKSALPGSTLPTPLISLGPSPPTPKLGLHRGPCYRSDWGLSHSHRPPTISTLALPSAAPAGRTPRACGEGGHQAPVCQECHSRAGLQLFPWAREQQPEAWLFFPSRFSKLLRARKVVASRVGHSMTGEPPSAPVSLGVVFY